MITEMRVVLPARDALAKPACLHSLDSQLLSPGRQLRLLPPSPTPSPFPHYSTSTILSPTMPSSKPKRKSLKLASRPLKNGKSPLMSAPPEIRMRIYRYLFQGCRLTMQRPKSTPRVIATRSTRQRCEVLLSCKTTRQEALPILAEELYLRFYIDFDDEPMFPQVFRDVYFPRLKSLELSGVVLDLAKFPNLTLLCWGDSEVMWTDGDHPGSFFRSYDVESLTRHAAGKSDDVCVKQWMDTFAAISHQAENPPNDGSYVRHEVGIVASWAKTLRAKDRKHRVTTKVDFRLVLTYEGGCYEAFDGATICLLLVCAVNTSRRRNRAKIYPRDFTSISKRRKFYYATCERLT